MVTEHLSHEEEIGILCRNITGGFCFKQFDEVVYCNKYEPVAKTGAQERAYSINIYSMEGMLRE